MQTIVEKYSIEKQEDVFNVIVKNEPIKLIESAPVNTYPIIENKGFFEETFANIDGVNKIFYTSKNFKALSTRLYLNGLKLKVNIDYYERGNNEIEMIEAPLNIGFTDNLTINYIEL